MWLQILTSPPVFIGGLTGLILGLVPFVYGIKRRRFFEAVAVWFLTVLAGVSIPILISFLIDIGSVRLFQIVGLILFFGASALFAAKQATAYTRGRYEINAEYSANYDAQQAVKKAMKRAKQGHPEEALAMLDEFATQLPFGPARTSVMAFANKLRAELNPQAEATPLEVSESLETTTPEQNPPSAGSESPNGVPKVGWRLKAEVKKALDHAKAGHREEGLAMLDELAARLPLGSNKTAVLALANRLRAEIYPSLYGSESDGTPLELPEETSPENVWEEIPIVTNQKKRP